MSQETISSSKEIQKIQNQLNFAQLRTLPINDLLLEKQLVLRLYLESDPEVEIASTSIDLQKACYQNVNKAVLIKKQQMNIGEGLKSFLKVKLKFKAE